nr:translocation/assembly module TamB domain-containing protein [Peteryoungia ipomoeae]
MKRILVWTFRLLGGLIAAAVALVILVLLVGGFSRSGSQFVADRIASLVSTEERQITISAPSPLLSSPFTIDTVTVADTRGTYATIKGLSLAWSPLELLQGRFSADRIQADEIVVLRSPDKPAEESSSQDEPFSLPVEIDVRNVDLPMVSLGAALAGQEIGLSAQGSLRIADNTIASRLTATRLNDVGNNAIADILYAPNDNRLRIRMDYQEPSRGFLGNLIDIPGRPPLALRMDGDGPLNDWAGRLVASLAGVETVSVDTTHTLSTEGIRSITAKGGGMFADLLPPTLRDAFSGETAIDVAARLTETGAVTIDSGRLTSGAVTITAQGTYDPNGENDLKVSAAANGDAVDLPIGTEASAGTASIRAAELSVSGSAAAANLAVDADLAELRLPQGRFGDVALSAKSASFDLLNRQGPATAELTIQRAEILDPQLSPYVKAPMAAVADLVIAETIDIKSLTLASRGLDAAIDGTFDPATLAFSGTVAASAESALLPPGLREKLSGPVSASARIDFTAPQAVSIRELALQSSLGTAQGALAIDPQGAISANLTGRLNDVGSFIDNAEGAAAFDLSGSGPPEALQVDVTAVIEQGTAAGYPVEDLSLKFSGLANPEAPSGLLAITGQLDGKPVNADARLASANGQTTIDGLSLEIGPNRLTGALALDDGFKPEGKLDFNFPDLSLLTALAGQNISGDLTGSIALDNAGGTISGTVEARGASLKRDDLTIENPVVDLKINDLSALSAEGAIRADTAIQGTNRLENAALTLQSLAGKTQFDLNALFEGAPAQLQGQLTRGTDGLSISLNQLRLQPRGIPLALSQPTDLNLLEGGVTLNQTVIRAGNGRITINGRAGADLDLTVDITDLPASLAAQFAPSAAPEGTVNGRITVRGTPSAPIADYRLALGAVSVAQTRAAGLPALDISANGDFRDNRLGLTSQIAGGGINLGINGAVTLATGAALDLRVNGTVPLSALNGQLSNQGFVADGTAAVDLTIRGNAAQPEISGTVSTSGSRIVDVRRNLAVENLTTSINLTGSRAEIGALTGSFATGGTLNASGYIDIRGTGLPAELTIALDKAVYVDGDTVTSTADARLTLSGPLLAGPTLAGTVNLDRTSITLSERRPASLAELDIVHKNAPPQILRQQRDDRPAEGRSSSSPLRLDLTLSAPSQTFIRGRGIDAEVGGTIQLTGTAAAPSVTGAFELRRGRMQILTRRLDVTRATITFGGDLVPILDLEAQTLSGNATLTINLTGLASDPQVAFSSSPSLPQDEILAQILFGQSMSRLSALQIAQLADAAAQLAGGRGTSLFQALRTTLGIDDLDISTDETGQTTISAGKYLNDRTYFELQQTGSGDAKAVINLDVGRGVKLKGEAGGSGAGGGIFYEKEY